MFVVFEIGLDRGDGEVHNVVVTGQSFTSKVFFDSVKEGQADDAENRADDGRLDDRKPTTFFLIGHKLKYDLIFI